ncbi:bifunctional adenosylcobinamide kinase/adenosylcobinamide-phosphate guanylyltransferase [Bacillus massilinigeriensis]|uniref:bifunctional adenosylcobinamide kinase/adenosylcobinamide-phosphate guanylyltransferase n=1 Tax=Bacillus massilionigeriensis TaxID=1805475 RepID=UPI000A42FDEA|nr:bifunctional adenosylcobinamide kinase/adenosylcobinamide-phosphate guanylyltransferase [Bacillus massilionigeriensis]
MLIFITGGVRSGKSSFAEVTAITLADQINGSLHYIATGVPADSEMKERALRHQKDRAKSGVAWKTWEEPLDIGRLGSSFSSKDVILLDCVTTLLNNYFFEYEEQLNNARTEKIKNRILTDIMQMKNTCHALIVVSNEILNEPLQSEYVFIYKRLLGELHQQIVHEAKEAYIVEAGVPILMKGDLG